MLTLGTVLSERAGDILEGMLLCPALGCMREHPIIDGIPVIVDDLRSFVQGQLSQILMRDDISTAMDGLLGDCAGPGSEFERNRYHLSTYGRSHYGDLDPESPIEHDRSLVHLFEAGLELLEEPEPALPGSAPDPFNGPWIDIGCSVGRTTFEMAARLGDLVVGVDLNFGMLRTARQVASTGRVRYPLRRGGIVYEWREFEVGFGHRDDHVEFWACDAMALPFGNRTFAGGLSFNVTDCVPSPVQHLMEMGRVLAHHAPAIITTPYDWSANATPLENWIGGHSQRSDNRGESARELRRLLSGDAPEATDTRLRMERERESVPWYVYVHQRAVMEYRIHLVLARRDATRN